jgi:hypothetical protein
MYGQTASIFQNFSKFDFFYSNLLVFGKPKKLVQTSFPNFLQKPVRRCLTGFLIHGQDCQIDQDWGTGTDDAFKKSKIIWMAMIG